MPLLARMLAAPLRHRRPARRRGRPRRPARPTAGSPRRAGSRWRSGSAQGASIAAELNIADAEIFRSPTAATTRAVSLGKRLRAGAYEAVAGIGGGKIIDVDQVRRRTWPASRWSRWPPTWPTTASPRRSARWSTSRARAPTAWPCPSPWSSTSTGSARRPPRWAGPASATSSATCPRVADWELVRRRHRRAGRRPGRGHGPLRGRRPCCTSRAAVARRVPHRARRGADPVRPGDGRGRVQPAVQRRRPRDHARHRPALPRHGQPRRAGRGRRAVLRLPARRPRPGRAHRRLPAPARPARDPRRPRPVACADFAKAVPYAPQTRPGRYTILERLALSEAEIADRVEDYARAIAG